jgi:hypothetical protein
MKKFLIDAAKFGAGVVVGFLIGGGLTGYKFADAIERGNVTVTVAGEQVDAAGGAVQVVTEK